MAPADEDPLPFWFKDERGATAAQIAAAEAYIGHPLPQALRALLMQQDGGVSNFAAYEKGEAYYPLLPFFGVDPEAAAGTLMRAYDVREAFDVPEDVVVFAGQGNSWWGLDYRNAPDGPSVVYSSGTGEGIEWVAADFPEFLGGLTEG